MAAQTSSNTKLYLKIMTRQGVVLDQEVRSVSSTNAVGKFDVLQKHEQFISIIKDKVVVRLLDGSVREVPVDNGIMRVKGQLVQVFLGIKQ